VTSGPARTSVVVIGAGQAGLSVSYYLQRLGLVPGEDLVVFDRGPGTGGAWQSRWEALRIGSAHHINDLPGMDALELSFDTADRSLPAKDVVADYYRRYEEFYGFQVRRPVTVRSVFNRDTDLVVRHDAGELATDLVVNATGTWGSPFVPWYPGRDGFAGRQLHTTEYVSASEFEGQSVVVVGGGTSAIGFLLELEGVASELHWVTRGPVEFRDEGELNLEARVSAVAKQDEAAREGRALPSIVSGTGVPRTRRIQAAIARGLLVRRPMFASIEPEGVRWPDGTFTAVDAILWSTGFRPELRHLAPLRLREKAGGVSVGAGASWKDPRVFFAGYGPQASTIGANRAGRQIARMVVATLRSLCAVSFGAAVPYGGPQPLRPAVPAGFIRTGLLLRSGPLLLRGVGLVRDPARPDRHRGRRQRLADDRAPHRLTATVLPR
jgi:putative flavoprotein involved in K+ transport